MVRLVNMGTGKAVPAQAAAQYVQTLLTDNCPPCAALLQHAPAGAARCCHPLQAGRAGAAPPGRLHAAMAAAVVGKQLAAGGLPGGPHRRCRLAGRPSTAAPAQPLLLGCPLVAALHVPAGSQPASGCCCGLRCCSVLLLLPSCQLRRGRALQAEQVLQSPVRREQAARPAAAQKPAPAAARLRCHQSPAAATALRCGPGWKALSDDPLLAAGRQRGRCICGKSPPHALPEPAITRVAGTS